MTHDTPTREPMEPLPCPFCGEVPRLYATNAVMCRNDACAITFTPASLERWNRRVSLSPARPADRSCDEKHPFGNCDCPARPAEPTSEAVAWLYTDTAMHDGPHSWATVKRQYPHPSFTHIKETPLFAHPAAPQVDAVRWQTIRPFLRALYVGTGTWQIGFADEHDELMANVPHTSSFARAPHNATVDEVMDIITAHPLPSDAPSGEPTALQERVDFWRRAWHALDADHRQLHDKYLELRRGFASPPQDAPRRAISDDEIIRLIDWIRQHRATLSVAEGSYAPEFIAQTRKEVLALCASPAAPVDLSAVEAAIDIYGAECEAAGYSHVSRYVDRGALAAREALLSLYRTALYAVPAHGAGETK